MARSIAGFTESTQKRVAGRRLFFAAIAATVLAAIYWSVIASDRYVSEAHVVVDRTDVGSASALNFGAILTGSTGSQDLLLLRDHLLSIDMLNKLDEKLNLRAHFSDESRDALSRMWARDTELERFHEYYLSRVSAELDDFSGVLKIRVQAFTPAFAQAVSRELVAEGERFMNEIAHRLAREQVVFIEDQVQKMGERVMKARSEVVQFQNVKGLVSPQGTVETLAAITAKIEGQLAELKAKKQAMLGYLSPDAADVAQVDFQIKALEKQKADEELKLTSTKGKALNRVVEEFQRLQLEAEFAQDVYRTALVALEKGRVEATRTLKKLTIVQSPSLPEYPLAPRRIYNVVVFALGALLIAGIAHLLGAIIRDHKD
ncbi:MAG: chain-length determining protein [Zoogloeaceae bacterium]|nr:chain-length determining protein [Zoogloeaceae bacterium]